MGNPLIALLLFSPFAQAPTTARIDGQVVERTTSLPVENVTVGVDLDPADGTLDVFVLTDAFGFFQLENLPPGSYTLRVSHPHYLPHTEAVALVAGDQKTGVIRLDAIDAGVTFDIIFQVLCVSTQARLQGANISISYWIPDGTITGPPDNVFAAVTGPNGTVTLPGMVDGFYVFSVTRTGWEPISYPMADSVRLIRSHLALIEMKPIPADLVVTVSGFDPVQNQSVAALAGIILTLTGIDPTDGADLVAARSALSGEDGTYTFAGLAPINWRLTAGRMGYVPQERTATANGAGAFNPEAFDMQLSPTKVKVVLSSPYLNSESLEGETVLLKGIDGSNTAGIDRQGDVVREGSLVGTGGATFSYTFETLLPGRYWVYVAAEKAVSGLPATSGILTGATSYTVRFFPRESYAEVAEEMTETVDLELEPVPATIRGHLIGTDELANLDKDPFDPKPNRIFHSIAQAGIEFVEHDGVDHLPVDRSLLSVDTDESGGYTITITPGRYGIRIPTMTQYTGHNVELGDLTAGQAPTEGPWPYPATWPYSSAEFSHHGAWIHFDSSKVYQLDLYVHKQYINLSGNVRASGEPIGAIVLKANPDGSNLVGTASRPFFDSSPPGQVTGGGQTVDVRESWAGSDMGFYVLKNLAPGTYSITGSHIDYNLTTVNVTIAPWSPPGIPPPVAPADPTYFFPGITHILTQEIQATWATPGTVTVNLFSWDPVLLTYDSNGSAPPEYIRAASLANKLYTFFAGSGTVPFGSYTVWKSVGSGWFSDTGSGTSTFNAYEGGPLDNTPAVFPPFPATYTIEVRALNAANRDQSIPNVTVTFSDGSQLNAATGVDQTHNGSFTVTTATHNAGVVKWVYSGSGTEIVDVNIPKVVSTALMTRGMTISGVVTGRNYSGSADLLVGIEVVIRNRYGHPLAKGVTGAGGGYSIGGFVPQAIYVCINEGGFIPFRRRHSTSDLESPDITGADIELQAVPQPAVDPAKFTMNRFGLFLPGVLKSGDSTGFDPDNARDRLKVTWSVEAAATQFTVTLAGYDRADGSQGPDEVHSLTDRVRELWIVDRRWFSQPFVNDPNQTAMDVTAPNPLYYEVARAWLDEIDAGRKNNAPYYVVHKRSTQRTGDVWSDTLNLWELPSGVFSPMAVVITDYGAVKIVDYALPEGQKKLQGMRLPTWAATVLEVIGTLALAPKIELGARTPEGKFKAKRGAEFQARIDESGGYLTYKFVVAIDWKEGMTTPGNGPLAWGANVIGIDFRGASLEFEVKGKEQSVGLAIKAGIQANLMGEGRDKLPLPPIGRLLPVTLTRAVGSGDGKIGTLEILDPDFLDRNRLPDFRETLEATGKVDLAVNISLAPVLGAIPVAGPILVGLNASGALTVDARFELTVGGKVKLTRTTYFPVPASLLGSFTPGVILWDFAGGKDEVKTEFQIIWRVAAGLQISALRGVAEGTGLVQVGAPANATNKDGVLITIGSSNGVWPVIKKVEGAFSLVGRVALNLYVVRLSKEFQVDLGRFAWELGSDPVFQLVPINLTYTRITPSGWPPEIFLGDGATVIQGFFDAGSLDVSSQAAPLMVYTGIDPDTGQMVVLASVLGGDGKWSTPQALAMAPGVLSVAVAPSPGGGWIVVWSQIAEADIGNPFPPTTIQYVVSDSSGSSWSSPANLVDVGEAATALTLVQAGSQILLVYLSTSEGPLADNHSVHSAAWNGTAWSGPVEVLSARPISGFDVAGNPAGGAVPAVLLVSPEPGNLLSLTWNGTAWSAPSTVAADVDDALSAAFDAAGQGVLAWENDSGVLTFAVLDPATGLWTNLTAPVTGAATTEVKLLPITVSGETKYLLVWIASGEKTSVWFAFLKADGTVDMPPTEATPGSTGQYTGLELRPVAKQFAAKVVCRFTASPTEVREFQVTYVAPSTPGGGTTTASGGGGGGSGGFGMGCAAPPAGLAALGALAILAAVAASLRR